MQLREMKAKLDEDRKCLDQLERALKQGRVPPRGGGARARAREVNRQIVEDGVPNTPAINRFPRAS